MNMATRAVLGRLRPASSALFVCDVQEKFRPIIAGYPTVIDTTKRMVRGLSVGDYIVFAHLGGPDTGRGSEEGGWPWTREGDARDLRAPSVALPMTAYEHRGGVHVWHVTPFSNRQCSLRSKDSCAVGKGARVHRGHAAPTLPPRRPRHPSFIISQDSVSPLDSLHPPGPGRRCAGPARAGHRAVPQGPRRNRIRGGTCAVLYGSGGGRCRTVWYSGCAAWRGLGEGAGCCS